MKKITFIVLMVLIVGLLVSCGTKQQTDGKEQLGNVTYDIPHNFFLNKDYSNKKMRSYITKLDESKQLSEDGKNGIACIVSPITEKEVSELKKNIKDKEITKLKIKNDNVDEVVGCYFEIYDDIMTGTTDCRIGKQNINIMIMAKTDYKDFDLKNLQEDSVTAIEEIINSMELK